MRRNSGLTNGTCNKRSNVRVLGTDWKDKEYTGHELTIPIHWHLRDHNWSTSTLRSRIYEEEKNKKEKEKILFNLNHII